MTTPTLTIGIPTFNRHHAVMERIDELFADTLPPGVKVLVIDNHSTDGTFDALSAASTRVQDLRVLRNEENLGYAGNLFRLIDEAETDYLLVDSDEDQVLVEEIPRFLHFLSDNDAAFVSPQAIVFGRVYRGSEQKGKIKSSEFRSSSNYLSGITFNVHLAREVAKSVKAVVHKNAAAFTYPQVLIAAELLCKHSGLWYPRSLTVKQQQLTSYIVNPDGGAYYRFTGRYQQAIGFYDYLSELAVDAGLSVNQRKSVRDMLLAQQDRLLHDLRGTLKKERPEMLESFDKAARHFYSLPMRIGAAFLKAIKNPRRAFKAIVRRFS